MKAREAPLARAAAAPASGGVMIPNQWPGARTPRPQRKKIDRRAQKQRRKQKHRNKK